MSNVALSRAALDALARRGVTEIVLCAGARNAPLVVVLDRARGVKTHAFFEERSAGFFALGRAVESEKPVAIVTTSGTAVAELLPAVIEADYRGVPLVVVSADRPRRYRGSGAPQTITQPGLFSVYVEATFDVEGAWAPGALDAWSAKRPAHLNLCFDEPLVDGEVTAWDWGQAELMPPTVTSGPRVTSPGRAPLVIGGPLSPAEADFVRPTLRALGRPLYLEAASQLRGHPELADLELRGGAPRAGDFDSVIRVGGVPTLRLWRDLERLKLPVTHFAEVPRSGLPGGGAVHALARLADIAGGARADLAPDRARAARLAEVLDRYPKSEPAWVHRVSTWLPENARLFLGNSLPIREWDLAATRARRPKVFANRGTNGIDGLVSTFAGVCDEASSNWAVLGDLSTLYDLTGPWAWRARPVRDVNLVVINNGGGKIFERLFKNPLFENRHDIDFAPWAKLWRFDYQLLSEPADVAPATRPRVIEIRPDADQTDKFWTEWGAL